MVSNTKVWATLALFLLSPPNGTMAEDGPSETVVSSELCSGLWVVPLLWSPEGEEPRELVAIFDTGAGSAFIDPDCLERISGKRIKPGKNVHFEDMSVAGKSFAKFRLKVQELDHISAALGRELDVFLPFQAFGNYLLTLDYPRVEMSIAVGELPKPDEVEVFSSRGKDDRPWLKIELTSDRKRSLLIDSGSTGSLSIRSHRSFEWVTPPAPLRVFQGMYDLEFMEMGRLSGAVKVGPLTLADPIVYLTEETELIGAKVLQHFVVTFDQRNKRVRLATPVFDEVRLPAETGTGAVFSPENGLYRIVRVVEGSPAESAGLQIGDIVTHIDGLSMQERGCRSINPMMEDSCHYAVQRGDERFEVEVRIEALIP